MAILSPFEARLFTEPSELTYVDVIRPVGVNSDAGLPCAPTSFSNYTAVGGRSFAPYTRHDSPSRESSGVPYDLTAARELVRVYPESMKLLSALRHAYVTRRGEDEAARPKPEMLIDIYGMGIALPYFLHTREADRYPNGTIPSHVAMLRQGLIGVGSVLLNMSKRQIKSITAGQVVEIAEQQSELVGPKISREDPDHPQQLVCPASRIMIERTVSTLLDGGDKEVDFEDELGSLGLAIDLKDIERFQRFVLEHGTLEDRLRQQYQKLLNSYNSGRIDISGFDGGSYALLEGFREQMTSKQTKLFAALGRTAYKHDLTAADIVSDWNIHDILKNIDSKLAKHHMLRASYLNE